MPQNIWPVEQEGQPGRTRNRRTPRTCSTSSRSLRTGPPRRELFLRTGLPSERPGSEVAVVGPCGCDQVAAELVVAAVMEAIIAAIMAWIACRTASDAQSPVETSIALLWSSLR